MINAASDLEALAASVADSAGVQFVPALHGWARPCRPDGRGSLSGLSRGVGRGEDCAALIEALAYQVRAIADEFRRCGVELVELRADGGVAAMDMLLQLQATNSRVEVLRSSTLEATARGAASIAGLAIGFWSSLEDLAARWRGNARFLPGDPLFVDAGYSAWLRALERA